MQSPSIQVALLTQYPYVSGWSQLGCPEKINDGAVNDETEKIMHHDIDGCTLSCDCARKMEGWSIGERRVLTNDVASLWHRDARAQASTKSIRYGV